MPLLPPATILVVEADPDRAGRYRRLARARHNVDLAASATEAKQRLTNQPDIVFVSDDRSELTATINRHLSGDAKLALITDSPPTGNIYEAGYDGYLVRPVDPQEFDVTVRNLLARTHYARRVDEHFDLATRIAEIETTTSDDEPGERAEYRTLKRRLEDLEDEIEGLFRQVCTGGPPIGVFYDLDSDGQTDPMASPPGVSN